MISVSLQDACMLKEDYASLPDRRLWDYMSKEDDMAAGQSSSAEEDGDSRSWLEELLDCGVAVQNQGIDVMP